MLQAEYNELLQFVGWSQLAKYEKTVSKFIFYLANNLLLRCLILSCCSLK